MDVTGGPRSRSVSNFDVPGSIAANLGACRRTCCSEIASGGGAIAGFAGAAAGGSGAGGTGDSARNCERFTGGTMTATGLIAAAGAWDTGACLGSGATMERPVGDTGEIGATI